MRRIRFTLEAGAARGFTILLGRLPESWLRPISRALGSLAFLWPTRRRRVTLGNLRLVFPALPEAELEALGLLSFQNMLLTFLESMWGLPHPARRPLLRLDVRGREQLDGALGEGSGLVIVAAHLGNWELLGAAIAQLGYPHRALGKRLKNPRLSDWLEGWRRAWGVETLWISKGSQLELLEILENKGIVSIVADQDARDKGVWVPFLGHRAPSHRAPAMLALAAGCPVIAASIVRIGTGARHLVRFERVDLPEPTGKLQEDVELMTAAIMKSLGRPILEHPADYLWAHDRFKGLRERHA